MRTYKFDNDDLMPAIGLGTWQAAPGEIGAAVHEALRLGYRHLDCAAVYGNEAEIGEALQETFSKGQVRREDLWITSKLWNTAHAPDQVQPALGKTLADLRLDYLDLYLIHWPVAMRPDCRYPKVPEDMISLEELPITSTWSAMEEAKRSGLTRHIGVSNFSISKLRDLVTRASTPPEVNQIELHPYLQQGDMLAYCREQGITLTAYSPLGSKGRPAGLREPDEPVLLEDPTLQAIATRYQASVAQVALAWAVQRGTSVIPKSVNAKRLAENLAAAELTLTAEDMRQIAAMDRHRRYVSGGFWAIKGGPYTLQNLWDE